MTILLYRSRCGPIRVSVVRIFRDPTSATHLSDARSAAAPTSTREAGQLLLLVSQGLYCRQRSFGKMFGSLCLDVCVQESPSLGRMPAADDRHHQARNPAKTAPCPTRPLAM